MFNSHKKHQDASKDTSKPTTHTTPSPETSEPDLVQLQRELGNQAVQRLLAEGRLNLSRGAIQAKMTVGAPDDAYEHEADSVAKQVMGMQDPVQRESMGMEEEELLQMPIQRESMGMEEEELLQMPIQRESMGMEEEELLQMPIQRDDAPPEEIEEEEEPPEPSVQMKHMQFDGVSDIPLVTDDIEEEIDSSRGNGNAMPDEAREFFEPRFGQDFSNVNIHTGSEADGLNQSLSARAFTTGSDIYFRDGEYNPSSDAGRELLAHELTHVVQQGGSETMRKEDESTIARVPTETIQRNPAALAMGAAEWIAVGTAGYQVAQDAVTNTAGDISYSFDEMEGVVFAGGAKDVAEYRKKYPSSKVREYEHTVSIWGGTSGSRKAGIKFGIRFSYDGHSVGGISLRILDVYDWPMWAASAEVNITPIAMSAGDVSTVRFTINFNTDRTFLGGDADSAVLELDGEGTLSQKAITEYLHLRFSE